MTKTLFTLIRQEITGIEGIQFHQAAGGDEPEPEGRMNLSSEAFLFPTVNPTVRTGPTEQGPCSPSGQIHLRIKVESGQTIQHSVTK